MKEAEVCEVRVGFSWPKRREDGEWIETSGKTVEKTLDVMKKGGVRRGIVTGGSRDGNLRKVQEQVIQD